MDEVACGAQINVEVGVSTTKAATADCAYGNGSSETTKSKRKNKKQSSSLGDVITIQAIFGRRTALIVLCGGVHAPRAKVRDHLQNASCDSVRLMRQAAS